MAASLVLVSSFGIMSVQAVHLAPDTSLELDGNVAAQAALGDDWNDFYPSFTNTTSFRTTGIVADGDGQTIFTGAQSGGSSKDGQDIPGWRWKCGSVPAKDEIANAASAKYTISGEKRLYFMADREATNGDSHIGVWFLQNSVGTVPATGCPTPGTFSAAHKAHSSTARGDILVLADFTNGGASVDIKAFEWYGTGGNDSASKGALNFIGESGNCLGQPAHPITTPPTPELCATNNVIVLGPGNGADATANTADDGPDWTFTPKSGTANSYPVNSFFEGGIDLNSLGLEGECFGSVLSETRSSDSTDAVLKDFVVSPFEACSASIATTPSAGPYAVNTAVTDSATITASGPAPTGTVDFYICGPTPGLATCSTSGTQLTPSPDLSGAVVLNGTYTVTSAPFTPTTPGDYCFFGTWAGNSNYPGRLSDNSANECFTVPKLPSSVVTQVHNAAHVAITNTSVTQGTVIHDNAVVTGSAGGPVPTGSVTFTLYSTIDCSGSPRTATPPTNPETVALTVGATSSSAESTSWTPAAGVYSYKASYGGSTIYNAATDSACEPITIINPTTTFNKTATPAISTTVTYAFAESNDGSVPLNPPTAGVKSSVVQDSQCAAANVTYDSGDTNTNNILDPGETWNFTCSKTYTGAGTFTNTAIGHGIDPVGKDVTWCADPANPGTGIRCDQDETDTTTVTISVDVTQGKP